MNSIELHVDELILEGFAPGDRHRIADAVAQELRLRLRDLRLPATPGHAIDLAVVDGGAFPLGSSSSARRVGVGIANALSGSLSRALGLTVPPGATGHSPP